MASSALDEALFQRITILSTERKKQLLDLHDNGCLDELLTIHGENEIKLLVELRNSRPQVLQDIIADDVPAEPVLNYIQDLDTRVHIFEEFRRLSNRVSARNSMNAAIFSVFMVAPITQLEYQLLELQNLERGGDLAGIAKYFGALASTSLGILAYANRGGRQSQSASSSSQNSPLPSPAPALASPSKRKPDSHERIPSASYPELQASAPPMKATPQPSTPPANMLTYFIQQSPWSPPVQSATNSPQQSRNKTASNICKVRDHHQCVLTHTQDPEAAHIFPFGTSKHTFFPFFMTMLHTFWDPNQAIVWNRIIKQTNTLESPQNLISLSPTLHCWFDKGKMALKPLRQMIDGSIIVQFHWLKSPCIMPSTPLPSGDMDMDDWLHKAGLADNSSWGNIKSHRWSGIPIETGQIFTLKANNPNHIPSFELLQLSWDFLRIVAICGAAEAEDLLDDNGSGNGYFGTERREATVSIWNEDDSAQLRDWVGNIENDEELEHDANSSS